ncbi:aldo/keto reductase [Mesorhizobium sp. M2D.F.Ca.ET.185.01.1.1]|uniref:aldo/keto reductase n=1 Tax=unclassified Mesorhizobium TaxID=325217 RepID=UPI000FCBA372|nr:MULTISPECIES: aldo/keto reductase [unclassified Mesorhizobium]TGP49139.1 aldo/keto reductase [bacterium M00.F.Ca.ET.230.01.1.1]TGP79478.1 aldo/keto reductase [bacterium M00.F.Ca.ET.227.01.1.1]TGQ00783.1 aldo/keto reductase [bacterium M00.F.Ca.ET.221.01.1.1]TGQ02696.1 aldo/keto reductase [bacterium M00.F.Ca.ET.222.01.1.1]TGU12590.1 aldo/keto reductase [bacterium M00.F.Ca.ET.163.01.1.1]TGU34562.1 aldo/keto reductase [bacterium M00.F.Ca.ET.156.01.1.1]TGU46526.1 aldo/keto reductase [bacterium
MPEQLKLNDGSTIPQIGLGVWQVEPSITAKVVRWGIEAGYRLIDTAEGYRNEEGVGEAIRAAGVPRSELFITSKLRNGAHQRDAALRAFDDTMQKLGIDRIDLFLIHWPVPAQNKYLEAWKTLVELQKAGRIKSVGVSNFNQDHLERIIGETGVTPVVNQIELHPRFQQRDKRDFHRKHNIHIESWSPLGSGRLLADPMLEKLAKKHGKSVAQVIIRWHLQEGLIVIPKSIHQERIAGNFDVFGFELDADDMQTIRGMDSADGRTGPDPATAAFLF